MMQSHVKRIADFEERSRAVWRLQTATRGLLEWQRHIMRQSQQRRGRLDMMKSMKFGEGNLIVLLVREQLCSHNSCCVQRFSALEMKDKGLYNFSYSLHVQYKKIDT